jgi:dGTP triphosphohydrolase
LTTAAHETNVALKRFLRQNVYNTEELVAERRNSALHVAELFEYLVCNPHLLPEAGGADTSVARRTCDFIASMTDGGFRRVYRNLLTR